MTIKQGKNEYSVFLYGTDKSPILGISKAMQDGKYYTGKNTHHTICMDCGKIIGCAMGGFTRHAKACKLHNEEWAKKEIQRLYDADNFRGLNTEEKQFYNYLTKRVKFTPEYNCPA